MIIIYTIYNWDDILFLHPFPVIWPIHVVTIIESIGKFSNVQRNQSHLEYIQWVDFWSEWWWIDTIVEYPPKKLVEPCILDMWTGERRVYQITNISNNISFHVASMAGMVVHDLKYYKFFFKNLAFVKNRIPNTKEDC